MALRWSIRMRKYLSKEKTHNKWDKDLAPLLTVDPGDVVEIETKEGSDGEITPQSSDDTVEKGDVNKVHPLTGPIYIRGARPGDSLVVEILDVKPDLWGWSYIFPGRGYLKDIFKDAHLVLWKINKEEWYAYSDRLPDIRVPLSPFCGVMGVALPEPGSHSTKPPSDHGGNMDIEYLAAGSTLYLPVFVDGALFSVGDVHAAQGDGEVCLTAIETSATVTLKFDLRRNRSIPSPRFENQDYCGVVAYGRTLDEAMRKALRYAIDLLVEQTSLAPENAYVLCSVAARFKICEVVNEPHVVISGLIPKKLFSKKTGRPCLGP